MLERTITVRNALGLHARAAAKLVRLARKFNCIIKISRVDGSVSADAKSILSVLYIAAGCGSVLILTTDGDDEAEAMKSIDGLFADGFGEL